MKNVSQWVALYVLIAGTVSVVAAKGQKASGNELVVPAGTEFKFQLQTSLNSKTSKVGDHIEGSLVSPAYVGNEVAFPTGTRVEGYITSVKHAAHRGRGGAITPVFNYIELADGRKISILGLLTEVFQSKDSGRVRVDLEGDLQGRGPSRLTEAALVAGAAAGGGVAGIGVGIAAGIGGVFGAIFLPRGHDAALEAGSVIGMRLVRATVVAAPQKQPVALRSILRAHRES